ncbi:CDP-glucose 4,6-dehydratase [Maridesulfovibrio sp.]|uniref:CDP-glucose 4,6-dehydratase n=1 Tax=Maridesulfovibrio sp. TaxID=2795000 RepID=UPI0039EF5775
MESLVNFYRGKRVFITGATGFKGGWLVCLLQRLGALVSGYSLAAPSSPSLWELASLPEHVEHCHADILDREVLKKAVFDFAPDIIFHLAAQSLVRLSYDSPFETLNTNVMGTASVLEAALNCDDVRAVLNVTSDKCYRNIGEPYPYKETDSMGGDDPYSASKGCAELVTHAYRKSFFDGSGKGLASVRAGNVIGGGDFAADRLIPDMVRAFSNGEPVAIRYPAATRPWQHVLDPLFGYLLLAQRIVEKPMEYDQGWNFGPLDQETHTVGEVVELFSSYWEGISVSLDKGKIPHEAAYLGLDCTKARNLLGWSPRLSFEESVFWTANWYRKWRQGSAGYDLCLEQVDKYLSISV